MIVLALDTTGDQCTVGLRAHGRLAAQDSRPAKRGHAEILMPQVASAFGDAGLRPQDVDVFGATVGPGSFTGIRVGLAALAGLALGVGRPMVGFTRFAAYAATVPVDTATQALWVCLDNRRSGLFVQRFERAFDGWQPAEAAQVRAPAEMHTVLARSRTLVAGDGAALLDLPDTGPAVVCPVQPGPNDLAILVETRAAEAQPICPAPVYLGEAAVTAAV